jgi:hypothetical protein
LAFVYLTECLEEKEWQMKVILAGAVLAGGFWGAGLLAAGAASAHHSFAMFDFQKVVTIEGTVKQLEWANPHVWLEMTVKVWGLEAGPTAYLSRSGWKRDSLKPGDKATVTLHPLKLGERGGSLLTASMNDQQIGKGTASLNVGGTGGDPANRVAP